MAGEIQIGGTTFATESGGTVTVSNVDSATNRANLGLGSMATQNANAVALTGGSITGTEIDLKSSGTTIYASNGSTAVLSESGGLVTIADTVQHVVPIVNANRSADQTGISAGVFTKVLFNNEVTDTHNFFDASSSYRFQPTIAGYYIINTAVSITTTAGTRFIVSLFKAGSEDIRLLDVATTADAIRIPVSSIIQLNGSSDYIEIYGYADTSNALSFSSYGQGTFFNAFLLQRT